MRVIRMYKNGFVKPIIYQCFNARNSWHLETSRKSQNPAIKCRSALFLHFGFCADETNQILLFTELEGVKSSQQFPPISTVGDY